MALSLTKLEGQIAQRLCSRLHTHRLVVREAVILHQMFFVSTARITLVVIIETGFEIFKKQEKKKRNEGGGPTASYRCTGFVLEMSS